MDLFYERYHFWWLIIMLDCLQHFKLFLLLHFILHRFQLIDLGIFISFCHKFIFEAIFLFFSYWIADKEIPKILIGKIPQHFKLGYHWAINMLIWQILKTLVIFLSHCLLHSKNKYLAVMILIANPDWQFCYSKALMFRGILKTMVLLF